MNGEKKKSELEKDTAQIDMAGKALCQAIKDSMGYKRYHKALDKLKHNKNSFQTFNEFRQKNLILELGSGENKYSAIEQLYAEYKDLLVDRDVAEFLTSEQQMCQLIKGIHEQIAEAVDMDLSYFEGK